MKLRLWLLLVLLISAAQDSSAPTLTAPLAGDILRGQITITGATNIPNFLSAQLDFAYVSDPTGTWFALQTFSQPIVDSALTTWDTTVITDGDYILRLRVALADGTSQEVTVPVKIQNDVPFVTPTPIPTATPESITVHQIPTPFLLAASPTPTEVPRPTPTPLPTNSAALNQNEIYTSLGRGALVIVGLFAFAGLMIRIRRS